MSDEAKDESVVRPQQFDEVIEKLAVENLRKGLIAEREARRALEEISVGQLIVLCDLEEQLEEQKSATTNSKDAEHRAEQQRDAAEKAKTLADTELKLALSEKHDAEETSKQANLELLGKTKAVRWLSIVCAFLAVLSVFLGYALYKANSG